MDLAVTRKPLTRAEAEDRSRLLHVSSYAVTLDLTGDGDTFRSTSRVRFACRQPGATTFAEILAPRVAKIEFNGLRLDPAEVLHGNRIRLDVVDHTNELTVVAECSYSRTGEGLHRFVDPADGATYTYSQTFLYDAQRVFACFDQPDLKASYDVTIVAPAGWTCVANGDVVDRPAEGAAGAWTFARTPPVPTYITFFGGGPYHSVRDRHGDVPLAIYCRASLAKHLDPDEVFAVTKQCFDYYEATFGVPYPFGKYDQLFVPEFNAGAMENAGAVTFREESAIFRSRVTDAERQRRAETVAHELAHMWFGNLVTMRWWNDLWLNESFATWLSTHALGEVTRFRHIWVMFCNTAKARAYRADQLPSTHPVSTDVSDTDTALDNFDPISYEKGASVIKQLTLWVGFETFVVGLRDYVARHAWGNTTLADLLAALAEASGRDLDSWAHDWLRTAGVTTLRPAFETDADGVFTSFAVAQEPGPGEPALRAHTIAIGLYDVTPSGVVRREQVVADIAGALTGVPELVGKRRGDLVLVNDDDLTYAKLRLDPGSLATLRQHAGRIADPLARALCWAAAWDMTRDAELGADGYVALATAGAAEETDIGVVTALLDNALAAARLYAPDDARAGLEKLVAESAKAIATSTRASAPAGDRELAFARAWIEAAGPDDAGTLRARLLAGDDDTELRWRVLTRLAALGTATEDDIAAELRRDATADGLRRATAARAARPDPAAKEAAWVAAVESDALSNHLVIAAGEGFWQWGQDELLRPYAGRYLAALDGIWRSRSPEIAHLVTARFFPRTLVTAEVVTATREYAGRDGVDHRCRRILLERADELDRALRARAAG